METKYERRVLEAQTIEKFKLWLVTWNHVKKVRDVIVCEIICNCFISRWPQVIYCNIFSFFVVVAVVERLAMEE